MRTICQNGLTQEDLDNRRAVLHLAIELAVETSVSAGIPAGPVLSELLKVIEPVPTSAELREAAAELGYAFVPLRRSHV